MWVQSDRRWRWQPHCRVHLHLPWRRPMTVTGGGNVTDSAGIIAVNPGEVGTVTVSGANSTWTNSGNLYVGFLGTGTLTIQRGGTVSDVTGEIGTVSDSSGTVTVSGPNGTWTNTGTVRRRQWNGRTHHPEWRLVQVGGFGLFVSDSSGTGTQRWRSTRLDPVRRARSKHLR